jgi:transcriptional regulator with GAF, ATPase, and Fis domain
MYATCSAIHDYCYLLIVKTSGERTLNKKLADYLDSKKTLPNFPIIIFIDYLPPDEELQNVIVDGRLVHGSNRPFILAVKERSIKDRSCYWRVLELGFEDVIDWSDDDEMICYLTSRYERSKTITEVLESSLVTETLIGNSITWRRFLSDVIEATLFSQASILLIGGSGTGKELISRLIHAIDTRVDKKKLIIVDCTTIVPELSGSELFGHERGSYTSAVQSREGAFALANGGTLFLDEAGELPMHLQAELLRVLQEGTYKKVGSNTWQKTNFRLVCATNKDLRKAVEEGTFRQDLYFRIADCEFLVPNLSCRKDDVPLLVNYFLSKAFPKDQCPEVDKPVMDYLVQRDYPGNVRELKQLVQRIALKHVRHKKITIGEVPEKDRIYSNDKKDVSNIEGVGDLIRMALINGENWWNLKDKISETAICVALELENNNKQKAAERLGIDVRTVQQYVKKRE